MKALSDAATTTRSRPPGRSTPTATASSWARARASLVLEELGTRPRRGATIYAEVVGYGITADAYHITAPGRGRRRRATAPCACALADAGLRPEDIDYINAHGTRTPLNDQHRDGRHQDASSATTPASSRVSSTKSMTGHLLGAAGAVEAVITRPGHRARHHPADHQLRDARPGLRPGLRAQRRPARPRSSTPCRTPSASAGRTAVSSSAALNSNRRGMAAVSIPSALPRAAFIDTTPGPGRGSSRREA